MATTPAEFKEQARKNAGDARLKEIVRKATTHSLKKRAEVVAEVPDWEELRQSGHEIRREAVENLASYLEQFEQRCTANGVHVLWANDSAEACAHVERIVGETRSQHIVKSKSMVTEEIGLNEYLGHRGIESVETDLGEYIVQLAGETPSHITAPALHKSREDIGKLFAEKLGVPYTSDPSQLTAQARSLLREKFLGADVGISGANFLVAETGTVVIVENEGNACLTTALPKVHIVVTGIEKVVPRLADAATLLRLLPRSATGQRITSYISFITSPRKQSETDGPEQLFVILVDNKRSEVLAEPAMRESLYCIRCGACMNVCPVYQTVGGHAYGSTYPGPIGAVVTPLLTSLSESRSLPFASSLCGACSEICPVKIDLHHLLLQFRGEAVSRRLTPMTERIAIHLWRWAMKSSVAYALLSRLIRLVAPEKLNVPVWSVGREMAPLAPRTFHDIWKSSLESEMR